MTLFLPVVGAWIGILWTLCAYLIGWLGLPALVGAAILCAFPFLVTGGMHMDGYLDVTDAVKSWRDADERRQILKDPNVGSFAVIAVSAGFVFLGKYGFASLAVIAGCLWHLRRAFKSLDGMSGDISGYALTFGEVCGIAVFALI